jgi:hypothetical protein
MTTVEASAFMLSGLAKASLRSGVSIGPGLKTISNKAATGFDLRLIAIYASGRFPNSSAPFVPETNLTLTDECARNDRPATIRSL